MMKLLPGLTGFLSLVMIGGAVLVMGPQGWAQDVGSDACRYAQVEAHAAIPDAPANDGQAVSAAAWVADTALEEGEITTACASCIMAQIAQHYYDIADVESCGSEVTCPCLMTPALIDSCVDVLTSDPGSVDCGLNDDRAVIDAVDYNLSGWCRNHVMFFPGKRNICTAYNAVTGKYRQAEVSQAEFEACRDIIASAAACQTEPR